MASATESMSTTGASPSVASDPLDIESETYPLWSYVTVIEKGRGGNRKWTCNLCKKTYNGSYSRVRGHLMKDGVGIRACSKLTPDDIADIKKLVREAEERAKPINVPLPPSTRGMSSSLGIGSSHLFSQGLGVGISSGVGVAGGKKRKQNPLEVAFNNESRDQARALIARMFYSSGLPFHLARSPYYQAALSYLGNTSLPGFVPPGYNSLRTTLLHREKANVERCLAPIKTTWPFKGVSIVTDGWTDAQRRPLINFMAVTESGPMFLRAVNCEGEVKNRYFISGLIIEVVKEVGPENVVQIITDNAAVCKAAGLIVETTYPHIFWTPCVVHTLNLALKNICAARNTDNNNDVYEECGWISELATEVVMVKNFITLHSMRLAMYNDFVNLKLLSVAETRFASTLIVLKRFKLVKQGLQALVISDKWSTYREDDVGRAQHVKDLILNDLWWDSIDYVLSFTGPIYDMLRFADTDKPCLHLIYDMWDSMIEKVKRTIYRHEKKQDEEESSFYEVVHSILVDRWNKSNTPLHCLAHSLNPLYYTEKWLNLSPNRVPPHRDSEISEMRMNCFRRYFPVNEERRKVLIEYAMFSQMTDKFANYDSIYDRAEIDPGVWWTNYGSSTPMLFAIATKLLGQPCSSSCSERNWSTYSFIHSLRRNKIQPKRAEDLVYVHSNLRLLSRKTPSYTQGVTKLWDVAGDAFEPLDGAGELEIATLSLDEPEMEAILFDDGDTNEDEVLGSCST